MRTQKQREVCVCVDCFYSRSPESEPYFQNNCVQNSVLKLKTSIKFELLIVEPNSKVYTFNSNSFNWFVVVIVCFLVHF